MIKKDYFVRSCIYNRICVVGKKETIYPLVQTVNSLYLQLLEMHKAFTSFLSTIFRYASCFSNEIKELQTEYRICLKLLLTSWMVQNICGKESHMNNNLDFQFGMYAPAKYSILSIPGKTQSCYLLQGM